MLESKSNTFLKQQYKIIIFLLFLLIYIAGMKLTIILKIKQPI